MSTVLEVRDVAKYFGGIRALDGVTLSVPEKGLIGLIGPNGAGKTTLLNTIFGIATIHEGEILFEDKPISLMRPHEVVRVGISYAPQLGNVFPNLTVEENLQMGAFIRGKDPAIREDMEEIFRLFPEIERRRGQKAKTLSGGERQMLAVARALMTRPKFLLLDEPTAGLSPRAGAALIDKIREIRDRGVTILMVEQNVKRALDIADRGYVIVSGRIVREDSAENLMKMNIERLFFTA
jgi:ABC-type branched-subunit amino acid transport system ATPase component